MQPYGDAASAAHTVAHTRAGHGVTVAAGLGDTDALAALLGDALPAGLADAAGVGEAVVDGDGLQGSQQAPGLVALPAHSQLAGGQAS